MIQGQKDVSLSNTGCQQAELVAERLAGEKIGLVFSSDLQRAKKVRIPFTHCM
jgi:broad specificity phosphatase PhoE